MSISKKQSWHIEPPWGLLNDPNGLIWYKGNYYAFFQWNRFAKDHSNKAWGFATSPDLVHWQFRGSALERDGKLCLYYTSNVKQQGHRISRQCLAVSEDGRHFRKLGPVLTTPAGYTEHFRDPKVVPAPQGDWTCNTAKLPGGIEAAADLVHGLGLKFGLWFEPEAVSRDSDLYRAHHDWILQVPGLDPREGRHEYLLDLGRAEVRQYLLDVLHCYLGTGKIDYIKWDMNRPMTDAVSAALPAERQGEVPHRYILGLYEILREITRSYLEVLFEGCSSGGARRDAGMLAYFAQNWTSDNTDARDRIEIQAGFSLLYPPEVLGAHVSITPNHQTGRTTPLETRFAVARLFNLGYALDLTRCPAEYRTAIAAQVTQAKTQRDWLMQGTFWRHAVPRQGDRMMSVVSADQSRCPAVVFRALYDPLGEQAVFRFCGLDPARDYRNVETGQVYGGDELMEAGLTLPPCKQGFVTHTIFLCAES